MRILQRHFIWSTILAGLLLSSAAWAESDPAGYIIPRQIRFRFVLQNPKEKALVAQVLRVYAPVKKTSMQWVKKLSASHPYELESDDLGNQIMVFRFNELAPYATKIISITADLRMAMNPQPSDLKDQALFLGAERFIESDHDEIISTVALIPHDSSAELPHAIFNWVHTNIAYAGFLADDLGALYAIRNRRGDCTEFANLFVALARTQGIPARTLGGFILIANAAPKASEYHNWAEYYADGIWQLADPQFGNFKSRMDQYVAMNIISAKVLNSLGTAHRYRAEGGMLVTME